LTLFAFIDIAFKADITPEIGFGSIWIIRQSSVTFPSFELA